MNSSGVALSSETILDNVRAIGPEVEAAAEEIERERRLPQATVEAMRDAGVFRAAFPKSWGGPEMHIVQQCEMIETLAYRDASAAWVAMICSDSGHYAARIDQDVAHELYPDLDMLTSGLLMPAGRAIREGDSWRISGRWAFGSGSLHADRIVGGCLLFDGDAMITTEAGVPTFRVFWLPRDAVEVHDTWHTTGLAGSGSNDYSVESVLVPDTHSFDAFGPSQRNEVLYRYHGFFFANLSAVAIGCARRMLDDLRAIAETKISMPTMTPMREEYRVQIALAESIAQLRSARLYQDDVLHAIWNRLSDGDEPTLEQRAEVALMSVNAVQTAHAVAEAVCEAVGSEAIYRRSAFDRRRRDLATIAAHIIGQRKAAATAAAMLLGVDPPFSLV